MKKHVIFGSMFLLSMGMFAQDGGFSYRDKVFHKDVVLKPKYDEFLVKFRSSESQLKTITSIAQKHGVIVREMASSYNLALYTLNEPVKYLAIAEELKKNPQFEAIAPVLTDIEGNALYYFPKELTVQFQRKMVEDDMLKIISKLGCTIVKKHWTPGYYTLRVDGDNSLSGTIKKFNLLQEVEFSELNYTAFNSRTSVPNDPFFNIQWGLHNTGQPAYDGSGNGTPNADIFALEAWNITKGNEDILICVTDYGFDMHHPDLIENYYQNLDEDFDGDGKTLESDGSYDLGDINTVDNDNNNIIDDLSGFNFFENYYDVNVDYHGTNCAGIAAAVANNNRGISGVAPDSRILPLKFDNPYSGRADAINYAVNFLEKGVKIVLSCSWKMDVTDIAIHQAIKNAFNAGIPVICAAGNDSRNQVTYPSRYLEAMSIGSTNRWDLRLSGSGATNYGVDLDVSAPGREVYTTDYPYAYNYFGQSSGSTPFVAGAAALLLDVDQSLTPWQVQEIIQKSSDKVGTYNYSYDPLRPGHSLELGYGRINAYKALISRSFRSENESNNTYTYADGPILDKMNMSGSISTAGESDWYYFDIQQTCNVTIYLFGKDKTWAFYANPSGNPLSSGLVDTDDGVVTFTTGSRAPGRYYLKISGNTTGNYDFTITGNINSAALFETEPNNTFTGSDGLINPGQIVSAKLATSSDIDWYWFETSAAGTITVTSTTAGKTWSLYSNPSGTALKTASGTSTYNITAQGRYYIKYSGTAGSYDFKISGGLIPCVYETEFNNEYTAADGRVNNNSKFSGKISASNDVDWYFMDVTQAGTVTFKLDGNYKSLDLYTDPYASYVLRVSVGSQNSATGTYNFSQAGRYYLKVTGYVDAYYFSASGNLAYKEATEESIEESIPIQIAKLNPVTSLTNYPNPFAEETTIEFDLRTNSSVSLKIVNLMGQEIMTLMNEDLEAGIHSVIWNATNKYGSRVENGIYLLQLETDGLVMCERILVMR